jgi:hypothetical protein
MGKVRTTATVFELPRRLGILQYVEYEPPRREWCTSEGCPYEGLLTAEGCKKGVCIKYRVWVWSKDGRRWEAKEKRRRRRDEEAGGCLRQQVADALWELAERFTIEIDNECNVVINGVAVPRPRCRGVEECVKQMLEEYKKKLESPPPLPRNPEKEEYEQLLRQYAWLGWWSRDVILDALQYRRELLNLLQRLDSVDIPHFIKTFIGRLNLDVRCLVDVYRGANDIYCISFCIKDFDPRTYCYERSKGWHATPRPKFLRLRPLPDGQLVEVYALEGRELVRVT